MTVGVTEQPAGVSSGNKEEEVNSSEVLEEALGQLGHFGFYQRYVAFLLCLPSVLAAMYSLGYIFVADQVPFRCAIPECEGAAPVFSNESAAAILPSARCRRFAPLPDAPYPSCERQHYHQNLTIDCEHIVYEKMGTIVAEFDLGCAEWRRTLVGSVRNAALPLALILVGFIADKWGRRTALCICGACAGALGLLKSFAPLYSVYVALEFLEAALGYGFNSAAYVMMIELARESQRAAFAAATGMAYGLGGALLALLAWRLSWRALLRAAYAPALLLPLAWLLLDESPRWLYAAGRKSDAARVIRKAGRWNKKILDEEKMKALESGGNTPTSKSAGGGNAWLELVKSRVLMVRFLLTGWCWIAAAFVYYGLTINSVALSGDRYVNFALNMAMEVAASLLLVMALERVGRRRAVAAAFLLCGVACITPYFVSHSGTGLGLFMVGKLSISFAFNAVYVWSAELFPTRTRQSALAACSLVGRLGSVLAPQTPLLSLYVQAGLYGACALLAALAALAVPETRRARLPLAARDAERLVTARANTLPPVAVPATTTPRVISADDDECRASKRGSHKSPPAGTRPGEDLGIGEPQKTEAVSAGKQTQDLSTQT